MEAKEFIKGIQTLQELANKSFPTDLIFEIVDTILSYRPIVITFGNGGSFTIAEHLSNDLLSAGIPTITLGSNQAILTAKANDVCYEDAPIIELSNLLKINHPSLLICFSVSGMSKNVIKLHSFFADYEKCIGSYLISGQCDTKIKNTKIIQVVLPKVGIIELVPYAKYWICENTFSYIAHLIAGLVRIRLPSQGDEHAELQKNTSK